MDKKNSGGVNMQELRDFMQENNHFCNEKQLQLLFERIDRDQDGEISFTDFIGSVTAFMGQN